MINYERGDNKLYKFFQGNTEKGTNICQLLQMFFKEHQMHIILRMYEYAIICNDLYLKFFFYV